MILVTIAETLLYLCFCLLGGSLVFYSIDQQHRPDIQIPKRWLLIAAIGAGILSFAPILYTILILGKDTGYWSSFVGVLFTFQIGKAWIITLILALLILGFIHFNELEKDPMLSKLGLIIFIGLIAAYTKAGHAASLMPMLGFGAHFLHLLAVTIWGGCLLVAAWFSQSTVRWANFLHWFTPLAIICIIVVIAAGFGTMMIDIAKPLDHSLSSTFFQYKQSMVMNYGQALIIKHLLIIPLILYAFFNGFYAKRLINSDKLDSYRPIHWARMESVIVLFIFMVTAFMGQQTPPHDVSQSILVGETSPLFSSLYSGNITSGIILHFSITGISISFFAISVVFLLIIALFIMKKASGFFAIVCSVAFLVSCYLGIMSGIH
ncbi:MAG: copper resistance D family protein [Tuberibacillus sp.]